MLEMVLIMHKMYLDGVCNDSRNESNGIVSGLRLLRKPKV